MVVGSIARATVNLASGRGWNGSGVALRDKGRALRGRAVEFGNASLCGLLVRMGLGGALVTEADALSAGESLGGLRPACRASESGSEMEEDSEETSIGETLPSSLREMEGRG